MSDEIILRSKKPPIEIPLKSVGEVLLEKLQELNDESTCIIEAKSGEKLTVKELISRANSVAVALVKRGITKSDKICIFSSIDINYTVISFATYFLGIAFVPFCPSFTAYEVKKDIECLESVVIFTSVENAKYFDEIIENFNSGKNENLKIKAIFVIDGNYSNYIPFEKLLEEGKNQILDRIPYFDIDPKKDIFQLLRSSGTTGLPKIIILSHYNFVALLTEYFTSKQLNDLRPLFPYLPGHISSTQYLPFWISYGATVILLVKFDEELYFQTVEKYKINLLPVFPTCGRKLIEGELAQKYDLSSVKMITTLTAFDAKVSKAIVEKYNVIFQERYGMTEFVGAVESASIENTEYIPGNCGHVSRITELKIVDIKTGQSLGPNIDGEIWLRGPQMFSGYLNNIEATKQTIDSNGWLHTGDIGHYDQNERLFITDRIKEMIKYRGFPVSPVEIEQFLLTHESVAEVVVVGIKHEIENQWPRAYVKLKEGKSTTEEELINYVADTMGFIKQLRAGVIFVDEIPRISVGKIDRKYFKQLVSNEIIRNS